MFPNFQANGQKWLMLKSDKIFKDFDNQMVAIKNVLLENIITAKSSLQYDLALINKISQTESTIKALQMSNRN
jgi:hypothetical protein